MNRNRHPYSFRRVRGVSALRRAPRSRVRRSRFAAALAVVLLLPTISRALPSFARQINQDCITCHTAFPVLNEFGRQFKLSGYTSSAEQSNLPPLAVMLQPSFTHTAKAQEGGAAPGFGDNNNWALTQASIFYGGRLFGPYAQTLFGKDAAAFLNKFGIFCQSTYDGVGKAWSWDNTELRFADTATIGDNDLLYGFYANNNPGIQDPWNAMPSWGFPFTGSGVAPGPAAATLIDGGLAQQVMGVGAYLYYADTYYLDVGAYHTLGTHLQKSLGVDPEGEMQVDSLAPYWRVAIQKMVGSARWEVGAFGLMADVYPGRDASAGHDRIVDVGIDSQYQISSGPHDLTAMASWINERQNWDASSVLGNTANARDSLHTLKLTLNEIYDKTFGATVQYFLITGGNDPVLYGNNPDGSPMSDGFVFQADYLPFNKHGGPAFWPKSNVKLSLQYTMYNRFDGARHNYDGAGANASDNNTLYLEAWFVF